MVMKTEQLKKDGTPRKKGTKPKFIHDSWVEKKEDEDGH